MTNNRFFLPFSISKLLTLKKHRNGFSLIELLTVTAILATLATVAAPSLLTSWKSASLSQGGNQLFDLMTMARQSALSRNLMTAVILVTGTADSTVESRTFGILEMGVDHSWQQVGGWTFLPEAVHAVDVNGSPPENVLPAPSGAEPPRLRSLRGDSDPAYTAFVFYPDGRMRADSPSPRRISVRFKVDAENSNPVNYYDLVFNADTSRFWIERP